MTASLLTFPTAAATSTTGSSGASGSSSACAGGAQEAEFLTGHAGTASLTNVATRQGEHYSFYMATEGESLSGQSNPRSPRVQTIAGCSDSDPKDFAEGAVRWRTDSGSASSPDDFAGVIPPSDSLPPQIPPRPGETDWICNDAHNACSSNPGQRPLPVVLASNSSIDEAVRSFRISLVSGKIRGDQHPGGMAGGLWSSSNLSPFGRTNVVHIVDDDGPNRFSLQPLLNDASQPAPYVRKEAGTSFELWLPVFRAGGGGGTLPGTATVNYDLIPTEDHPATPATGTTNNDFRDLTNGSVQFPADWTNPNPNGGDTDTGPRLSWIKIRLYKDGVVEEPETFDVVLTSPNNPDGAISTTVTIEDSDVCSDGGPPPCPVFHPFGKLHHPKQGYKYPRNYPYLNEIHLFTQNAKKLPYPRDGCPGPEYCDWRVTRAELAIRKRFKGGKCVWWTGNRFVEGGCSAQHWFPMKKGGGEDYFLYRITEPLPKSVGESHVRDYKAWSRWFDVQDNESTLREGANMNLFEVIPGTKACRKNPFGNKCKPIKPG
jgi:hypothetical protein